MYVFELFLSLIFCLLAITLLAGLGRLASRDLPSFPGAAILIVAALAIVYFMGRTLEIGQELATLIL